METVNWRSVEAAGGQAQGRHGESEQSRAAAVGEGGDAGLDRGAAAAGVPDAPGAFALLAEAG